jgi:hypothetical protein
MLLKDAIGVLASAAPTSFLRNTNGECTFDIHPNWGVAEPLQTALGSFRVYVPKTRTPGPTQTFTLNLMRDTTWIDQLVTEQGLAQDGWGIISLPPTEPMP